MNKLALARPSHGWNVSPYLYAHTVTHRQPPPDWVARSSPGLNVPLVPRVERLARGIRAAAEQIETQVNLPFEDLYAPDRVGLGFMLTADDMDHRSAWALIGEWLVAASVEAPCAAEGLRAAHQWFWQGSDRALGDAPELAVPLKVSDAVEVRALMPYLLDPMAAATRRDVLNAQSTNRERRTRKASGVYYTPGDVAYLMARRVMAADRQASQRLWLDPAHGSGVFLRAALCATYDEPGARDRIYGVDIDPLAAETSAFVLTAEDLFRNPDGPAPWERWHRFRRNLATGDALLIDAGAALGQLPLPIGSEDRQCEGYPLGCFGPWRLESVFPEAAIVGFSRIVGNPPYAPLQQGDAATYIRRLHPVTGPSACQDISPVFVELCTDLLPDDGALALVLPLSVVSSTRAPFPELRSYLVDQPGWLELLSFDRVPDALFGDDIKTRNAIVHLDKKAPPRLTASPLYRWTSRTRKSALTGIPTTSIAGLEGVPTTIPKIGAEWERDLLLVCSKRSRYLDKWATQRCLLALTAATRSIGTEQSELLAIAPTAYNFLSVVRDPHQAVSDGHDSQNSFFILHFGSDQYASAAYALLNSRLAFWLWHIIGDGFHVTSTLFGRLPVPTTGQGELERLADLGDQLWKEALQSPVVSTNRGRTTVAYPTWTQADVIDKIDAEVGAIIGINYTARLAAWHEQLIVVDLDSDRRNLIQRKTRETK